jgi:hypothetical protein
MDVLDREAVGARLEQKGAKPPVFEGKRARLRREFSMAAIDTAMARRDCGE